METLSNLASAATQAVWPAENTTAQTADTTSPDSHSEPLSGVAGNTARGEPYDAGNAEEQDGAKTQKTSGTAGKAGTHGPATRDNEEAPVPSEALKGPGPKPIDQVAREHGGDAGRATKGTAGGDGGLLAVDGDAVPSVPSSTSRRSAQTAGQGAPATPATLARDTSTLSSSPDNHAGGTVAPVPTRVSDEYVQHSSGLQADGGDFDAARPGAGLEAERIREGKGLTTGKGAAGPTKSSSSGGSGSSPDTEKKSLGEKIKAKIHRKD